jgi:hypothetical protein
MIGRITNVERDAVTLRGVNTRGAWTRKHKHLYKNIEEIRFVRSHEADLVSVLPAD